MEEGQPNTESPPEASERRDLKENVAPTFLPSETLGSLEGHTHDALEDEFKEAAECDEVFGSNSPRPQRNWEEHK